MKRKRFTEEQIVGVLREHEAGATAREKLPSPWHIGADVVPLGVEGRGDGDIRHPSSARVGGGKWEATSGGGTSGQRGAEGAVVKKLVRPTARRQAVGWLDLPRRSQGVDAPSW